MHPQSPLPVDSILPEIRASLSRAPNLVIEAPPGAGKTTRVPAALLEILPGEIWVLEPRRIAARMAARRVAEERGERLGESVGYQVRFDQVGGARTRLRFVTEGILTRRILADPTLHGISAVVLDEFHERHLEGDLALALLKRLQIQRPDLRLIAMSATLEAAPVAQFLGNCPRVRSEGRLHEIVIRHLPWSAAPLENQMDNALEQLLAEGLTGDVLAFLPGSREIRRAMRACEERARRANLLVLPLHGSLSPEEQDRAVAPASQRKLILATNVAESSITVDGVTAVIDSGLARHAVWSHWTGFQSLRIARVSKASAKQRAGRAGRTAPGRVLRTYTAEDYQQRPEHDIPEILRSDLAQLCLTLRVLQTDAAAVDWLDAPPSAAIEHAESLLDRLGAHGPGLKRLAELPLPPRLSRMLLEAADRGAGEQGCVAAALLAAGEVSGSSDLLTSVDHYRDASVARGARSSRSATLERHVAQLRRMLPTRERPSGRDAGDDGLLQSVLAGFPDCVGRVRPGGQIALSNGLTAVTAGPPPAYEFLVAVEAEDRSDQPMPLVRTTARIEPEWLIDLFPDRLREEPRIAWNRTAERVEAAAVLLYDKLILQESRCAPDPEAAAAMLAEKAIEAGIERFLDREVLDRLLGRAAFAGFDPPNLEQELRQLCTGMFSFAELRGAADHFVAALEQKMGPRLQELAPGTIRLRSGRQTKVHYEPGKPPWIASRLQDFFGMIETPRLGKNRTPVVVHLLAPNHRPVQTTTDLAGFWERLYPQVRRELMRRYPKHSWPEKP